jgi:integrase
MLSEKPANPQHSANSGIIQTERVHQRVHQRELRMASLRQDSKGNYLSRKKLPKDIRAEYGRQFGQCHEAKFFRPASTPKHEAKRQYSEWSAEVDGRILAIRSGRDGTGLSLTPAQARTLAGEWYEWWTARHAHAPRYQLEGWRDAVQEAICSAVPEADVERIGPDELWREREDLREAVRPVLADIGETAQFFATKGVTLTNASRNVFLDWLYDDLAAALKRLLRRKEGDFSPDEYEKRFPKTAEATTDSGLTPWQLFERWVAARKPSPGTVENWRYMLRNLDEHFESRNAGSLMPEEAEAWLLGLVTPERSAATVKNTWYKAVNTVYRWAVKQKHVSRNPFERAAEVLTLTKRPRLRETQAFLPEERTKILNAALRVKNTRKPFDAARRWAPWLCAYTGSRPSEVTQLRATDVIERGRVFGLKITPEAGTVKSAEARVVPLHEHLLAQGFLGFVKQRGKGPLFYQERAPSTEIDPIKRKKPPYAQLRQRLAEWVRELGIVDPELLPNHAWRHTFKAVGRRAGISDKILDDICGHAPATVGRGYGRAPFEDMAAALKQFPRYDLGQQRAARKKKRGPSKPRLRAHSA